MESNHLQIYFYYIIVFMIVILFIALIIFSLTDPTKSFNEFLSTNIYNSIPLPNEYKNVIIKYIPFFAFTPDTVTQKIIENAPEEILNNVCTNIDARKKSLIEQAEKKKNEKIIKISSDNIKKFSESIDESTVNISLSKIDNNNIDQLNNTFYGNKPWDDILNECKNLHGTIDDIDWKAYVYGYRPKIILY